MEVCLVVHGISEVSKSITKADTFIVFLDFIIATEWETDVLMSVECTLCTVLSFIRFQKVNHS